MNTASITFVILVPLLMLSIHPRVTPQNYTFEETVCIVSYTMGFLVGIHLSKDISLTIVCDEDAPLSSRILRVLVGYGIVLPLKQVLKELTGFMRSPEAKHPDGKKDLLLYTFEIGDFVSRLLQYGLGYGVGCSYFAPYAFRALKI